MKKEDVIFGMKVKPFQKTATDWGNLGSSNEWRNANECEQDFLYVIRIEADWQGNEYFVLAQYSDDDGGDYFNPEDFEPVD